MEKKDFRKAYKEYEAELAFMPIQDFDRMGDYEKTMAINFAKMQREKRRLVAEITELKGACAAEYKVGDKLVFSLVGMFLPEESTVKNVCSWLLSTLIPIFGCTEGLMAYDVPLKELNYFHNTECPDPGVPDGWGHARAKLYIR